MQHNGGADVSSCLTLTEPNQVQFNIKKEKTHGFHILHTDLIALHRIFQSARTHTHTDKCGLPFWGQCLCECAGSAQGLWYVAGPRPETHKDRPATGCEEGVVLECSHSPTDQRTHNTNKHTHTHMMAKGATCCARE